MSKKSPKVKLNQIKMKGGRYAVRNGKKINNGKYFIAFYKGDNPLDVAIVFDNYEDVERVIRELEVVKLRMQLDTIDT